LDGGAEWGGPAADPNGILYVNSTEMPWHIEMVKSASEEELESLSIGQLMYTVNCVSCHGADLQGSPNSGFPSLVSIIDQKGGEYVNNIISNGKGMMPAFGDKFSDDEKA